MGAKPSLLVSLRQAQDAIAAETPHKRHAVRGVSMRFVKDYRAALGDLPPTEHALTILALTGATRLSLVETLRIAFAVTGNKAFVQDADGKPYFGEPSFFVSYESFDDAIAALDEQQGFLWWDIFATSQHRSEETGIPLCSSVCVVAQFDKVPREVNLAITLKKPIKLVMPPRETERFIQLLAHDVPDYDPLLRDWCTSQAKLAAQTCRDTSALINNCAILLKEQGKLDEAEPLYHRALRGCRRSLGDLHPHTLTAINNYADCLVKQGKFDEAEPLNVEALKGRRSVLGKLHKDTLLSLNNYANLLYLRGKLNEAGPLYQEALDGRRQTLGDTHVDTLTSISNLGVLLKKQGKLKEAADMHRHALDGRRATLGARHVDTLTSMNNYANLLATQNKIQEAAALYREALDGGRLTLGDSHPHMAQWTANYARLQRRRSTSKSPKRRASWSPDSAWSPHW